MLDVACGTGEISRRVSQAFPRARVFGLELHTPHMRLGRTQAGGDAVRFVTGDAFRLPFPDGTFDLAMCRHTLQALPEPDQVVAEMRRVTRAGGFLHILAEDYAMMHFAPTELDCDLFWHRGPMRFAAATGTDLRIGRAMPKLLHDLGLTNFRLHYLIVDTLRVPREVIARIWEAWRDGYAEGIAAHTDLSLEETLAYFNDMLACLRRPDGYMVWQVPVLSVRVPG